MERIIKFRVWDTVLGGFIAEWVNFAEGRAYVIRGNRAVECVNTIVSQFTGLSDKTGREIYEGDVVREFNMFPGAPIEVVWNSKFLGWRGMIHGTRDVNLAKPLYLFEVIGNIYENPDLLKEKTP